MTRIMTSKVKKKLAVALAEEMVIAEMESYFSEHGDSYDTVKLHRDGIFEQSEDGVVIREKYVEKFQIAYDTVDSIIDRAFNENLIPANLKS